MVLALVVLNNVMPPTMAGTLPGDLLVSGYYCDGVYRVGPNGYNYGLLTQQGLSGRAHGIEFSPDGQFFYIDHYVGSGAGSLAIGTYKTYDGSYLGDAVRTSVFQDL